MAKNIASGKRLMAVTVMTSKHKQTLQKTWEQTNYTANGVRVLLASLKTARENDAVTVTHTSVQYENSRSRGRKQAKQYHEKQISTG